jgi:hypothetical protein
MYKFLAGVMCAFAVIVANEMIDGVYIAQLLLFAAGFATSAIFLIEGDEK